MSEVTGKGDTTEAIERYTEYIFALRKEIADLRKEIEGFKGLPYMEVHATTIGGEEDGR